MEKLVSCLVELQQKLVKNSYATGPKLGQNFRDCDEQFLNFWSIYLPSTTEADMLCIVTFNVDQRKLYKQIQININREKKDERYLGVSIIEEIVSKLKGNEVVF